MTKYMYLMLRVKKKKKKLENQKLPTILKN